MSRKALLKGGFLSGRTGFLSGVNLTSLINSEN